MPTLPAYVYEAIQDGYLWFADDRGVRHAACIGWTNPHWTSIVCSCTPENPLGDEPPDVPLVSFEDLPKTTSCQRCTVMLQRASQYIPERLQAAYSAADALTDEERRKLSRYLEEIGTPMARKTEKHTAPPIPEPPPSVPGEICVLSAPRHRGASGIIPFWQVRFWQWLPLSGDGDDPVWRLSAYCLGVPHTVFPSAVAWFTENELIPTGLVLPLPEYSQINTGWYRDEADQPRDVARPNAFVAGINQGSVPYEPLQPEVELFVEPMLAAGLDWRGWTQDSFYTRLGEVLRHTGASAAGKQVWDHYLGDATLPGYEPAKKTASKTAKKSTKKARSKKAKPKKA